MKQFQNRLDDILSKLNAAIALLSGWTAFILVIVQLFAVLMRYLFNRPPVWTNQISIYMLMLIGLLPMAFVFQRDLNIRVDFVTIRLRPRNQKRLSILNAAIGACLSGILFVQTGDLVLTAWTENWISMEMAIPEAYPWLLMPLGFALLFLTCLIKMLSGLIPRSEQAFSDPTEKEV